MASGRMSRVGRHLPTSGGLKKTLDLAREQGLEAVQVFVSNPRAGISKSSHNTTDLDDGGDKMSGS